jgi:hypothetical protein
MIGALWEIVLSGVAGVGNYHGDQGQEAARETASGYQDEFWPG